MSNNAPLPSKKNKTIDFHFVVQGERNYNRDGPELGFGRQGSNYQKCTPCEIICLLLGSFVILCSLWHYPPPPPYL